MDSLGRPQADLGSSQTHPRNSSCTVRTTLHRLEPLTLEQRGVQRAATGTRVCAAQSAFSTCIPSTVLYRLVPSSFTNIARYVCVGECPNNPTTDRAKCFSGYSIVLYCTICVTRLPRGNHFWNDVPCRKKWPRGGEGRRESAQSVFQFAVACQIILSIPCGEGEDVV